MIRYRLPFLIAVLFCVSVYSRTAFSVPPYGPDHADFTIVVMDPMAGPLACDCVQGYAQRKYEALADYLTLKTGKTFRVVWSESLEVAIDGDAAGKADLVIGKDSVIRHESKKIRKAFEPIASLTDKQGSTNQRGLFVVRQNSMAASLLDIDNYEMLLGPEDCEEKHSSPKATLDDLELKVTFGKEAASCSLAAKQLLAAPTSAKQVAIISSYAAPLLEGCGSIKKGDLRVIGETDEVPFISAFVSDSLSTVTKKLLADCLTSMKEQPEMLLALETKTGFLSYVPATSPTDGLKKK
jgi:ABC-type phosphate/phosphonate transport system substrate-binding protein